MAIYMTDEDPAAMAAEVLQPRIFFHWLQKKGDEIGREHLAMNTARLRGYLIQAFLCEVTGQWWNLCTDPPGNQTYGSLMSINDLGGESRPIELTGWVLEYVKSLPQGKVTVQACIDLLAPFLS